MQRTTSIDSNCSLFSLGLSQKAESISDLSTTICKCDDCLLGITDALADLVLWNSSNSIQYLSIDENTEVEQNSTGKGPQGQLKTNDKALKRKVRFYEHVFACRLALNENFGKNLPIKLHETFVIINAQNTERE